MAWTTPHTWSASEVPSAADFNEQIRDNMSLLKTPFSDEGKVTALNSATFADLSGTNLTGVVKTGAANDLTAGKNNFNAGATTRVVAPVGADKYDGSPGSKTPGSAWVEGDYLHHVASNGNEWRYIGTVVGTPGGAVVGSIWVETDGWHYIDEDGDERLAVGSAGAHSDAAAVAGSAWVETYIHHIAAGGTSERYLHDDVAHVDNATGTHTDSHTDSAPHSDSHTDSHSDVAHNDGHDDVAHQDMHTDHVDGVFVDEHTDVAHQDNHTDSAHNDSHSDSHGDNSSHNDSHTDHADHADTAHADNPESLGT